eukprot:TRINITY_DN32622_c0_g1_i1.p1 TRINITY_DN32622_c0_g1~~TRINITY_DN32622_c0_g1_i1.p1  ORF type:complete len:184 (-),score=33.75 TRINITY_DN32622_c0_g1_i1:285-779(-)
MTPFLPSTARLIFCSRTREYRRAVATCLPLLQKYAVIEIGCHEGITTNLISEHAGTHCISVLGLDRSKAVVDVARQRFSNLRFEVFDINQPKALDDLKGMWEVSDDCALACFLDLGGDARLPPVLHALAKLQTLPNLKLLVVKSEQLLRLRRNSLQNQVGHNQR